MASVALRGRWQHLLATTAPRTQKALGRNVRNFDDRCRVRGALTLRRTGADPKVLRRALRRIEELLDE